MKTLPVLYIFSMALSLSMMTISFRASACMPVITPGPNMKLAMAIVLEERLNLTSGQISEENLQDPQAVFPDGLGADCSGLDSAYYKTEYQFTINRPPMSCEYKGSIRMDGLFLNVDSEFTIDEEETRC